MAALLRGAARAVAFTGAGVSTAAGIGDYRGNDGKWTQMDRADAAAAAATAPREVVSLVSDSEDEGAGVGAGGGGGERASKRRRCSEGKEEVIELGSSGEEEEGADEGVPYEALRPTYTHEALALLHERGFLACVLSQNCDGLHALSGLPPAALFSLHGDVFTERCEAPACGARFLRDFYTPDDVAGEYFELKAEGTKPPFKRPRHAKQCETCGLNHRTGRRCDACGAHLLDTIINFGDFLEEPIIDAARAEADKADVFMSLGTLMSVPPACDLIKGRKDAALVVCNRQRTALDARAKRTGARYNQNPQRGAMHYHGMAG